MDVVGEHFEMITLGLEQNGSKSRIGWANWPDWPGGAGVGTFQPSLEILFSIWYQFKR